MEMRKEMLVLSLRRERVQGEAEELRQLVQMARAMSVTGTDEISRVPQTTICYLLGWIVLWCEETGHGKVIVPAGSNVRVPWLSAFKRPDLEDLVRLAVQTLGTNVLAQSGFTLPADR